MSILWNRSVLLVVLGVIAVLVPGQVVAALQHDPETAGDGDPSWRDLLERARSAGEGSSYEGRLLVVSFDGGPVVGELDVAHAPDGTYMTDLAGSWMLSRDGEQTSFGDAATGTLLRIDGRARPTFSPARLERNYDVRVAGREATSVGRAVVLEFSAKGGDVIRERLHLHERSGLVIRRETFDQRGAPVRLATYTSLARGGEAPDGRPGWVDHEVAPVAEAVSYRGRGILREVGWWVEHRLPGGFELVDSFAMGEDGSAVHLLYSDGLYSLSLYQQVGRLDEGAIAARGAERTTLGGMSVHRIAGAEPATYLWSGGGRTFTAVTDAPPDLVAEAAAALPADPPPTAFQRARRTLRRAAGALWPF